MHFSGARIIKLRSGFFWTQGELFEIFHPQTKESQPKEFSSFVTTKSFSWTEMRQLSFCLARSNTFFFLALSHFLYLSLTLSYTLTLTLTLTFTHTHTLYLSDSARNEDMGKNDVKTLLLHFVDLILEENTLMVHFDFPKAFFWESKPANENPTNISFYFSIEF